MKAALLVLGALLLAACGRESGPNADSPEKREAYERHKLASEAFETGDLVTAKARYQDLVDRVRASGELRGRDYYLDLARIHACLGEGEAAERMMEEYSDLANPENLGHYWSGLDMGLIHSTLGNTAAARRSFQFAGRALDQVPEEEDWMEPGRLLVRWLVLHVPADPAAPVDEAELRSVREALGRLRRPDDIYLFSVNSKVDELEVCDWNREAAILRGYFQALGLTEGPFVPEMPEATVSSREANFSLPASPHAEWQWFRPTTPERSHEYAWTVEVTNRSGRYEIGVWLIKPPGAAPQRGSLDDLVDAAWADVWKFSEDGRSVRPLEPKGRVRVEGHRILITLEDPVLIRQLFAGHPTVTMLVRAPERPLAKVDFPID